MIMMEFVSSGAAAAATEAIHTGRNDQLRSRGGTKMMIKVPASSLLDVERSKRAHMSYTGNEGPDQNAHCAF